MCVAYIYIYTLNYRGRFVNSMQLLSITGGRLHTVFHYSLYYVIYYPYYTTYRFLTSLKLLNIIMTFSKSIKKVYINALKGVYTCIRHVSLCSHKRIYIYI
jgi:hypothetical protein